MHATAVSTHAHLLHHHQAPLYGSDLGLGVALAKDRVTGAWCDSGPHRQSASCRARGIWCILQRTNPNLHECCSFTNAPTISPHAPAGRRSSNSLSKERWSSRGRDHMARQRTNVIVHLDLSSPSLATTPHSGIWLRSTTLVRHVVTQLPTAAAAILTSSHVNRWRRGSLLGEIR